MKKEKWLRTLPVLIILAFSAVVTAGGWLYGNVLEAKAEEAVPEVNTETDFDVSKQVDIAKASLAANQKQAAAITSIKTTDKKVAIIFEGIGDPDTMDKVLGMLDEYDYKATFFMSAIEAKENEELITGMKKAGHEIGSWTLNGTPHMETLSENEILEDLCRSQEVFHSVFGRYPSMVKCNATELTPDLKKYIFASGFDNVVECNHYLNFSSFLSQKEAGSYVKNLENGSIVSIKMMGHLDHVEFKNAESVSADAAEEKETPDLSRIGTDSERLLRVVRWLLQSMSDESMESALVAEYPQSDIESSEMTYDEKRKLNHGKLAVSMNHVRTIDREAGFVIRGIGDEKELQSTLEALQDIDVKATFFITGKEVEEYPQALAMIQKAGHEIQNGGYMGKDMADEDFDTICEDIYLGIEKLRSYGIYANCYMPVHGTINETIQEAASTMNVNLISFTSYPSKRKYEDEGMSAEEIVATAYKADRPCFTRGDLIYLDMDSFSRPEFMGELLKALYREKVQNTKFEDSTLKMTTMKELLNHTWDFPAATLESYTQIATSGKAIKGVDQMLQSRYAGNPDATLNGFTQEEAQFINQNGKINNPDHKVFLTFDDWGSEESIGKLLCVLDKWNVKATFFVKTQYVLSGNNDNLLRAIAERGHDIANHTNTHMAINIEPDQVTALREDLVSANQILSEVVGDTDRLTAYFRPPTLAVSKIGMSTVFDCGFSYIISGDFSTSDYECTSAAELADRLKNGVPLDDGSRRLMESGSVIVMHMSDTAQFTAEGLDEFFAYNESLPDGSPNKFQFGLIRDYL